MLYVCIQLEQGLPIFQTLNPKPDNPQHTQHKHNRSQTFQNNKPQTPNTKTIRTINHISQSKNNLNFSTRLVLLKKCPPKFMKHHHKTIPPKSQYKLITNNITTTKTTSITLPNQTSSPTTIIFTVRNLGCRSPLRQTLRNASATTILTYAACM